jgi:3-(3-hydroxy-phenyl)propionate hydroxylase
LQERYLGNETSAVYLMRPDQHVAARWTHYDANSVRDAVNCATGRK